MHCTGHRKLDSFYYFASGSQHKGRQDELSYLYYYNRGRAVQELAVVDKESTYWLPMAETGCFALWPIIFFTCNAMQQL